MHWFLAQLKPNADQLAKRNLMRQGFITFQPLERCTRVRAGRFSTYHRAFFSGYLFVSYPEPVAPWSKINSTFGIARLVSFAGKPAPVPAAIIAELQELCGEDGVMALNQPFAPGARVAVTNGTFADLVGEIERLTHDHRAHVLIDFLGKQTRVNLPATDLRPARSGDQLRAPAA